MLLLFIQGCDPRANSLSREMGAGNLRAFSDCSRPTCGRKIRLTNDIMAMRVIGSKKRLRQDGTVSSPAVLWHELEGGLNLLLGFSEE